MRDADLGALSRRRILAAGLAVIAPGPALAALPPPRRLAFTVFRNGVKVGEHAMTFAGEAGSQVVTTEVQMRVKLGPVPVYRYVHQAVERWSAGRFSSLETATDANGKREKVEARRTATGVAIDTGGRRIAAPANALPFTHWNRDGFGGPLFNPQEGKLLRVVATRKASGSGTQWSVRGEAEIDDWYDEAGVWSALRGRLKDGSTMEYRRI
ncbi:MAG TPA: DUF6134 family protein [Phenylobacterium sp.]|nr:DUF6134 family protein [Phenylobacterium sp.]